MTAGCAVRRPNIDEHAAEVSLSCAVLDPQLDGMLPLTELGVASELSRAVRLYRDVRELTVTAAAPPGHKFLRIIFAITD